MENMLRTPAAAEFLGVRPNTLEIWRHHKRGPKFYRVGRCIVYDLEDLEAFVRANGVHTIDSIQTEKGK